MTQDDDAPPRDELREQLWEFVRLLGVAGCVPSDELIELMTRWELDRAELYDLWHPRLG
jgi:hypothetical protein